jgi:cell division protein FtsI (penicillin-binding protein 3)
MYVKRGLSDDEIKLINNFESDDIRLLREQRRFYPVASLGNTIGFADIDNHGIAGLELLYNAQLAGMPTEFRLEKDARSACFYFKKETTESGHEGTPLTLTINGKIQYMTHALVREYVLKMQAHEGAALVMDPATGAILAMACYPDFDPNEPIPATLDVTKNTIITNAYELGSVMKPFTFLGALAEKLVTPDELLNCEGVEQTYINGIKVTTWKAHGVMPATDVLRLSNNIGTMKVAQRLGPKLYEHLKRCGFSQPTGIRFLGEQRGTITPPDKWSNSSLLWLSCGYEITATLLQLARAFCLFANRGVPIIPHLVVSEKLPVLPRLYTPEVMETLCQMLTVQQKEGTTLGAYIPGYRVIGKTGSANLAGLHGYDKQKSIYTFAGIIEQGAYKRVIIVFIREPVVVERIRGHVYASTAVVPVFKEIAQRLVALEHVPPALPAIGSSA